MRAYASTFAAQLPHRDASQFGIDHRQEPVKRRRVSVRPSLQQRRDVSRRLGHGLGRKSLGANTLQERLKTRM